MILSCFEVVLLGWSVLMVVVTVGSSIGREGVDG